MDLLVNSELRHKVLYYFFQNQGRSFYIKELSNDLSLDQGNLSKELKKLEKYDLIKGAKKGKFKVFTLNRNHVLFDKLSDILEQRKMSFQEVPAIAFGERILAIHVQSICSNWSALEFTSLCNSLIWGTLGEIIPTLPSFTERVIVADNGIDAEWDIEIPAADVKVQNAFTVPGRNIFQYKKRDIAARDRKQIITNLKSVLKGELKKIFTKTKKLPSNYILFINIDLGKEEKDAIKQSLINEYSNSANTKISILGAADLAPIINNLPHIRSAYFVSSDFLTWQSFFEKEKRCGWYGPWVDLIGREDVFNKLKDIIKNQDIKAVLLYGPSGIGKTRLVLESTRRHCQNVIFINDCKKFKSSDLRLLESQQHETIIVIDDAEPEDIKALMKEVMATNNLKLIITIPTTENIPLPSFGLDERTVLFPLDGLSDKESDDLLKATQKSIHYGLYSWIRYNARGNPSILLAAANIAMELNEAAGDFIETVGKKLEERIKRTIGEKSLSVLKLLSLLSHVGIHGEYVQELILIKDTLSESIEANDLYAEIEKLENSGMITRKGSFVEIPLPLLATYFAQKILKEREHLVLLVFAQLTENARKRFLERLCRLNPEYIRKFWDEVFSKDGLFCSLELLKRNIRIMRNVSSVVPGKAIEILENEICGLSKEERQNISNDFRRELMWTLDQLLFRESTSLRSLNIIGLLAEAENEKWGNNATGVFCECFCPTHPQMPLSLQDRYSILEKFSQNSTREQKILAIKAIENSLRRTGSCSLRESEGFIPFEGRPGMIWGDIWDYINNGATLLLSLAEDIDQEVSKVACDALPDAIAESIIQGRPEQGIEKFKKLLGWVIKDIKIDVSDFIGALNLVRQIFKDRLLKENLQDEVKTRYENRLEELNQIKKQIDEGSFALRLKRWAGDWTYELDDSGDKISRGDERIQEELQALARETIQTPGDLTDDSIRWLLSDEAKKSYAFFAFLGEYDTGKVWLARLEEFAKDEAGAFGYASYCRGLLRHSFNYVDCMIKDLIGNENVNPIAILYIISSLGANSDRVRIIVDFIVEEKLSPNSVERLLVCGGWIDPLSDHDFLVLLEAIAGKDFQHDVAAIDMLNMRISLGKEITGELADFSWRCLESAKPVKNNNSSWDYDQVASKLTQDDPERGFALAKKLLINEEKDCWDPIDRYKARKFWDTLISIDRKKSLELLLDVCSVSPSHKFHITWNLKEILDQEQDKNLIIHFSSQKEEYADIFSQSLSSGKPAFWLIALSIIEKYHNNKNILNHIYGGIEQSGFMTVGEYSKHLEKCHQEVVKILSSDTVPPNAKLWLQKIDEQQKRAIETEKIHEDNEDVEGFGSDRLQKKPNDNYLKKWAISKALKNPRWSEVIKQLGKEEIQEVLSEFSFEEQRRNEILERIKR